ncbi:hypothetical protein HQ584_08450, partial [Patescibacteria group bacterium]|nr:hypothetical protein [Patescibacteria group bacterium]
MSSRDIVLDSLTFKNSQRIPMSLPSPYPNDFLHKSYRLKDSKATGWYTIEGGREERIDEWGNTWRRFKGISKGEVCKGVLESLDKVEEAELPALDDYRNYKEVEEEFSNNKKKFKIGSLPGFAFNITRKMRRLDQYLMDLVLDKNKVAILNARVNDLLEKAIKNYAKAGADAIMFCEDWGTQKGLMINPNLWREIFKGGFTRLCNVAHQESLYVFMHSCGKITVIIPDLIECGIDVLQFDQPKIHGIKKLAEYSGKVTYWCPADIQNTLQTKDEKVIESDVREMIEKLGGKGGGFVAGYYA